MEYLLIGILIVLGTPYVLSFVIKITSIETSDLKKPIGSSFASGFGFFDNSIG